MSETELAKLPMFELCYRLDKACPPYWFSFSPCTNKIHVSAADRKTELAIFTFDEANPLDYVITKILLQFSGGTPVA